ncbi:hypothetical protein [Hyalangium versicolor]|uniref:hypothetical protein n=1 Tax=Hyalangium versicolor TaxID=2861190 RepID=UPI001CCCEC2F|nr:hypothetical protein [Hyalangium versicolor]
MKRALLLLGCLALSGCALLRRYPQPVHAPPEEAARVEFPKFDLPEGRQTLSGPALRAIQLAMDDFLPWDTQPHKGATPREVCLYQRESYDVTVAPGPEGIMFVRFTVRDSVCDVNGPPILDMGATYAVDVQRWLILAIQPE